MDLPLNKSKNYSLSGIEEAEMFFQNLAEGLAFENFIPNFAANQSSVLQTSVQLSQATLRTEFTERVEAQLVGPLHRICEIAKNLQCTKVIGETSVDSLKSDLSEVSTAANRCLQIIENLRTFSDSDGSRQRTPVAINGILLKTLPFLKSVISLIPCQLDLTTGPNMVRVDEQVIYQITFNLVTNACHAMASVKNPKLEISTKRIQKQGQEWVELMVDDKGGGISEAIRAQIFKPFFTTKKRAGGMGLGLCICKELAEKSGGEFGFETKIGIGSQFYLRYPIFVSKSTK